MPQAAKSWALGWPAGEILSCVQCVATSPNSLLGALACMQYTDAVCTGSLLHKLEARVVNLRRTESYTVVVELFTRPQQRAARCVCTKAHLSWDALISWISRVSVVRQQRARSAAVCLRECAQAPGAGWSRYVLRSTQHGVAWPARRSHLDVDDDDPTVGQKFSTETLRRGDAGRGSLPSTVHGAPETAEESREVLARLKRMAGFESQDFDPGVRGTAVRRAPIGAEQRASAFAGLHGASGERSCYANGSVVRAAMVHTCVRLPEAHVEAPTAGSLHFGRHLPA